MWDCQIQNLLTFPSLELQQFLSLSNHLAHLGTSWLEWPALRKSESHKDMKFMLYSPLYSLGPIQIKSGVAVKIQLLHFIFMLEVWLGCSSEDSKTQQNMKPCLFPKGKLKQCQPLKEHDPTSGCTGQSDDQLTRPSRAELNWTTLQ